MVRWTPVLLALALLTLVRPARAGDAQMERINYGYVVAFGRLATGAEIRHWKGRTDAARWKVADFVNNHAGWLRSSEGGTEVESVILRACENAWGDPNAYYGDVFKRYRKGLGSQWRTFTDLVKLLTDEMDHNKSFKEKVVRRSYAAAGLKPSDNDVWGWVNGFGNGKSYAQMRAEHEMWKARKAGKNTSMLSVSPDPIAREAIAAGAGIIAAGGGNIVAMGGGNIVAMGGGNVVAMGGNNFNPQTAGLVAEGGAGFRVLGQ